MNSDGIKIEHIVNIARKAGKEIMKVYKKKFSVDYKADDSPVTEADLNANEIIISQLQRLYPEIPILSEESVQVAYKERKAWDYFWLVDPLDGTKSFVKRTDEFTVNIALVKGHRPILGVIYAPAKDIVYYSQKGHSAYKQERNNKPVELPIKSKRKSYRIVVSRNYMNQDTHNFVDEVRKEYANIKLVPMGGAMKLCAVAEGTADMYPRMGPCMEWDTAAGHAILNAVGKKIYRFGSEKELAYNKKDLHNPWFVAK